MFSNFMSRVTGIRSPKALLASFLASSLGEFFALNPNEVEANLLSETKIVLKCLKLKTRKIFGETIFLDGSVGEVEFSWTWGGDETTPFIRETLLTIRGAKFRIFQGDDTTVDASSISSPVENTSKVARNNQDAQVGYLQRQVQQIVDHLTLRILDFELILESASKSAVVMQAQSLCLMSFGREENTPTKSLSQRISLDAISVHIRNSENRRFPLLDPFGYAATVTRVSGRRFVDGFMTGIEVAGDFLNEGELTIHADVEQAKVVSSFVDMFSGQNGQTVDVDSHHDVSHSGGAESQSQGIEESQPSDTSFGMLPLPPVKVILVGGTVIRMPSCTLHYRMDGSECRIDGTEGIIVNEACQFLSLEQGVAWRLDLAHCRCMVQQIGDMFHDANEDEDGSLHSEPVLAKVLWDEIEMEKLINSFKDLVSATSSRAVEEVENAVLREVEIWQDDYKDTAWELFLDGAVSMCIKGELNELISSTISASSVNVTGGGVLKSLATGAVKLGPSSFGDMSVTIPPGRLIGETKTFHLQDEVSAITGSEKMMKDCVSFLKRAFDFVDPSTVNALEIPGSVELPFDVQLPGIRLLVKEPVERSATFSDISISARCDISIASINIREGNSKEASVFDFQLSYADKSCKIGEIRSLSQRNVFTLTEPIRNITIEIRGNSEEIGLCTELIRAKVSLQRIGSEDSSRGFDQSPMSLPFGVHLQVEQALVEFFEPIPSFQLRGCNIRASNTRGRNVVEVLDTLTMNLINTEQEWIQATLKPSKVRIPLFEVESEGCTLGPTSFGQGSIEIPTFVSTVGGIQIPKVAIDVESQQMLEQLATFTNHLLDKSSYLFSSHSTKGTSAFKFPTVDVSDLLVEMYDPSGFRIQAKTLSLKESILSCERIDVVDVMGVSSVISGVKLGLVGVPRVSVRSIDKLVLSNSLNATETIQNLTVEYSDGLLQVKLPLVSLCVKQSMQTSKNLAISKSISLPFRVRFQLAALKMEFDNYQAAATVENIDMMTVPLDRNISIENSKDLVVEIASGDERIKSRARGLSALIRPTTTGWSLSSTCHNLAIGPSTFGEANVGVENIRVSTDNMSEGVAIVVGNVLLEAFSQDSIEKIQRFAQDLFAKVPDPDPPSANAVKRSETPSIDVSDLTLNLIHPIAAEVKVKDIAFRSDVLTCNKVDARSTSGASSTIRDLRVSMTDPLLFSLGLVESLVVPGLFFSSNTMNDVTLEYGDDVLQIRIPTASLCLQAPKPNAKDRMGQDIAVSLPFSIQVQLPVVDFRFEGLHDSSVSIKNIDMVAVPVEDSIAIENSKKLTVRCKSGLNWVETHCTGISSAVRSVGNALSLVSLSCDFAQVGPSTEGHLLLAGKNIQVAPGSDELFLGGTLEASFQSADVVERIKFSFSPLIDFFDVSKDTGLMFNVKIPSARLTVLEPTKAIAQAENIYIKRDFTGSSERVLVSENSGSSATLSGISFIFRDQYSLKIAFIETLFLKDVCSLEHPVKEMAISYDTKMCKVLVPTLSLKMLKSQSKNEVGLASSPKIDMPFPIHLSVGELSLKQQTESSGSISIRRLEANVAPKPLDPFIAVDQQEKGVEFLAKMDWVGSEMGHIEFAKFSGHVLESNVNVVRNLHLAAKQGAVSSGFSSVDWSRLLGGGASEEVVIPLPYAAIEPMDLHLEYKGVLVGTVSAVRVSKFVGTYATTSSDVGSHFMKAVLNKAPSFITNARIMGQNTSDMAGQTAGLMAVGTSGLLSGAGGSLTGVVAVDSVRAAIASGKKSRGASDTEGYRFGDITRGSIRAFKEASKSGAELRRGDSGRYELGDFTAGVVASASQYGSNNKKRLGSAAGSGVGLVVGSALLGPVGLVAGSIAGSMAGGAALKDENSNKRIEAEQSLSAQTTVNSSDMDLLGVGTVESTRSNSMATPPPSAFPAAPRYTSAGAVPETQSQHSSFVQQNLAQPAYVQQQSYYPMHPAAASATRQPRSYAQQGQNQSTYRSPSLAASTTQHSPNSYSQANQSRNPYEQQQHHYQQSQQHQHQQRRQEQGYRFGDMTRSIVAKGKEKSGRSSKDGYKFGDFTRGLFS